MRRRIEVAGCDIACFSALDFRNEHMVPDADTPFVPMPEGKTGQYANFYRILFGRFTGAAIAVFILTLRIDIRYKRDLLTIGRNDKGWLNACRKLRDLADALAVGVS